MAPNEPHSLLTSIGFGTLAPFIHSRAVRDLTAVCRARIMGSVLCQASVFLTYA